MIKWHALMSWHVGCKAQGLCFINFIVCHAHAGLSQFIEGLGMRLDDMWSAEQAKKKSTLQTLSLALLQTDNSLHFSISTIVIVTMILFLSE